MNTPHADLQHRYHPVDATPDSARIPLAMRVLVSLLALGFAGCAVGPNYQRPSLDVPSSHRTAESSPATPATDKSLADLGWWEAFKDKQLTAYLREALTNNWDMRIAAARVLQAEAIAGITRSQFYPTLSAGGDVLTTRSSETGPVRIPPGVNPQSEFGSVHVSMSAYEVDLWGKIRRANEAARARLLATVEAQNAVRQTLVSQVATAYLQLLELDLELDIARNTLTVRNKSLELTQAREQGDVASMQDVYQSRILVSTAEASIADIQLQREQKENELNVLLGRNPGPLPRGDLLIDQETPTQVPAGLPSTLLARRPDLRVAEQQLVAANADIGQAKAAFYPQLTLTGFYGFQSVALSDLFTGASQTWQFGPALTMPLFTGGRLRSNLKLAQAQFEEATAQYKQSVQQAFRDVSDGLIAYQRTREFREKQESRTQANREAAALANVRYEGGVTSYLEVLYNEQELFNAELGLAKARRNEFLSIVQLYRALGGGWLDETPQTTTSP